MERYRIKPGSKVNLNKWDADDTSAFDGDKEAAAKKLAELNRQLDQLQDVLFAERKHKLLIVLQAMDTGGKDGVIRHVFENVDPLGVRVANFKAPTPQELAHDYLWRIHKQTPANGEIVIFNRSHYEDVLIVRVHNLVPPAVWRKRYDHINQFERMLSDEGTTILKFFLHISKDEQAKRLQARLDDPTKRWKFNPGDLKERELWPAYMKAYEDVLSRTSTEWAPWYIIPANHKWYRNVVVATIIVNTLKGLKMRYPQPDFDPTMIQIK
ncbi:MAG: polyphosphate kinase 2 family protein [Acidobacteriota bacterium]|nr:polyphosphate kinase 2 family protein [Blastocatellia bacterium]MDW8240753.1 polyphosphate kinase 2 family protein [Acidobacteriota bacterium]